LCEILLINFVHTSFYRIFLKGYYFTLLDDEEGSRVVPILEDLLGKRNGANRASSATSATSASSASSATSDRIEQNTNSYKKGTGSRRRWANRRNQHE
jgi:hypothetical protein